MPLLAALLYISQPYLYLINMTIRAANSEFWAFAVAPMLLLGVLHLKQDLIKGFCLVSTKRSSG